MKHEANPVRILAVDDEPSVLEVLALFLGEAGYHVHTASGGAAALAAFAKDPWDVVLTDRIMPGMTGDDLAIAIKRISPETPVLMISGLGETQKLGPNPAIDGSIKKPFTSATLRDAVRKVVQTKTPAARAA
jgi:two-component system repressor protein LuxO